MKICPVCQTENEEEALYCKKCGNSFIEDNDENNKKQKDKKSKRGKTKNKNKNKTKTKHKTKVVKEKAPKERQKSSFFSKFLVFILLILVIGMAGVIGVFGYRYYQENNIEVPNVLGYSYEEATAILDQAKLSYQQKTVLTTEEDEVGVVVKQSKKAGSKVRENAVITLTVGVLDTRVEVPDVRGMTLEEAIEILNEVGISYQVVYEEDENEEENIILKQSVRPGKEINMAEGLTLTVSALPSDDASSDDATEDITDNPDEEKDNNVDSEDNANSNDNENLS